MKTLMTALLFSTLALPVPLMAAASVTARPLAQSLAAPDLVERRSGTCPKHGGGIRREGTPCGGV